MIEFLISFFSLVFEKSLKVSNTSFLNLFICFWILLSFPHEEGNFVFHIFSSKLWGKIFRWWNWRDILTIQCFFFFLILFLFCVILIFYYDVLWESIMGRPFWGRAKGPYWIPFCGPIIDHLPNIEKMEQNIMRWVTLKHFYF